MKVAQKQVTGGVLAKLIDLPKDDRLSSRPRQVQQTVHDMQTELC